MAQTPRARVEIGQAGLPSAVYRKFSIGRTIAKHRNTGSERRRVHHPPRDRKQTEGAQPSPAPRRPRRPRRPARAPKLAPRRDGGHRDGEQGAEERRSRPEPPRIRPAGANTRLQAPCQARAAVGGGSQVHGFAGCGDPRRRAERGHLADRDHAGEDAGRERGRQRESADRPHGADQHRANRQQACAHQGRELAAEKRSRSARRSAASPPPANAPGRAPARRRRRPPRARRARRGARSSGRKRR